MHRRLLALAVLALVWLGDTSSARAQFSQYLYPIEPATLQRNLEVQLHYVKTPYEFETGERTQIDAEHVIASVEGHYYFAERWEFGLNVPFEYMAGSSGELSLDEKTFGDLRLDFKARLFTLGPVSMAFFLDTYLATHSGERARDYADLLPGAAVTLRFAGLTAGGSAKLLAHVVGEKDDKVRFGLDAYGSYTFLGLLTLQLAFEYFQDLEHGDFSAVAFTPGVDIGFLGIVRAGVASRIAVDDAAKSLFGGRASLLFHGGIVF